MSIKPYIEPFDHFLEEDMPESQPQVNSSDSLKDVLKNEYQIQGWFITGNVTIYPPDKSYPFSYITPDVEVFPIVVSEAEQATMNSWQMNLPNRPAPIVVFEISSENTWKNDLDPKPRDYGLLGVHEYFAFDPQRHWKGATTQLRGWRYTNGIAHEIQPDSQGRLWSVELNSWLEADGTHLRLYNPQGRLRLTGKEAAEQREEAEREAKETAQRREEAERKAKQIAQRREEEAKRREEEAKRQAETALLREQALLEKLRQANIDIDKL